MEQSLDNRHGNRGLPRRRRSMRRAGLYPRERQTKFGRGDREEAFSALDPGLSRCSSVSTSGDDMPSVPEGSSAEEGVGDEMCGVSDSGEADEQLERGNDIDGEAEAPIALYMENIRGFELEVSQHVSGADAECGDAGPQEEHEEESQPAEECKWAEDRGVDGYNILRETSTTFSVECQKGPRQGRGDWAPFRSKTEAAAALLYHKYRPTRELWRAMCALIHESDFVASEFPSHDIVSASNRLFQLPPTISVVQQTTLEQRATSYYIDPKDAVTQLLRRPAILQNIQTVPLKPSAPDGQPACFIEGRYFREHPNTGIMEISVDGAVFVAGATATFNGRLWEIVAFALDRGTNTYFAEIAELCAMEELYARGIDPSALPVDVMEHRNSVNSADSKELFVDHDTLWQPVTALCEPGPRAPLSCDGANPPEFFVRYEFSRHYGRVFQRRRLLSHLFQRTSTSTSHRRLSVAVSVFADAFGAVNRQFHGSTGMYMSVINVPRSVRFDNIIALGFAPPRVHMLVALEPLYKLFLPLEKGFFLTLNGDDYHVVVQLMVLNGDMVGANYLASMQGVTAYRSCRFCSMDRTEGVIKVDGRHLEQRRHNEDHWRILDELAAGANPEGGRMGLQPFPHNWIRYLSVDITRAVPPCSLHSEGAGLTKHLVESFFCNVLQGSIKKLLAVRMRALLKQLRKTALVNLDDHESMSHVEFLHWISLLLVCNSAGGDIFHFRSFRLLTAAMVSLRRECDNPSRPSGWLEPLMDLVEALATSNAKIFCHEAHRSSGTVEAALRARELLVKLFPAVARLPNVHTAIHFRDVQTDLGLLEDWNNGRYEAYHRLPKRTQRNTNFGAFERDMLQHSNVRDALEDVRQNGTDTSLGRALRSAGSSSGLWAILFGTRTREEEPSLSLGWRNKKKRARLEEQALSSKLDVNSDVFRAVQDAVSAYNCATFVAKYLDSELAVQLRGGVSLEAHRVYHYKALSSVDLSSAEYVFVERLLSIEACAAGSGAQIPRYWAFCKFLQKHAERDSLSRMPVLSQSSRPPSVLPANPETFRVASVVHHCWATTAQPPERCAHNVCEANGRIYLVCDSLLLHLM